MSPDLLSSSYKHTRKPEVMSTTQTSAAVLQSGLIICLLYDEQLKVCFFSGHMVLFQNNNARIHWERDHFNGCSWTPYSPNFKLTDDLQDTLEKTLTPIFNKRSLERELYSE